MGNTREYHGVISGVNNKVVYDRHGRTVSVFAPELTVEVPAYGTLCLTNFTDDVDEARALVGRKVLVTVTVLDEEA